MIIEIRGGKSGFKEYLETGQKKGRDLHRDQLDQRLPLSGDLNVFEIATSSHEGDGQRYDHITLSFSENHVSDEMLQLAVDEFRNHALAAWPEDQRHRIAFYAEAHRPKILSYTNSETGEHVERLTHIHIGIGRRDLQTGESVEPLGYLGPGSNNLKFIDAFQESFNSRHGFASPKDNPKITPDNAVDILARYTGTRPDALGSFNARKAAFEVTIRKEILAKNITAWDDFGKLMESHGAVTRMRKGQFNECYRVKPHGADKAMRLDGVFYQRQFIERPTAEKLAIISEKAKAAYLEQMQPRKAPGYVAAMLDEWLTTKAREHRYLHTGSSFYKTVYQPADAAIRQHLLDEIERKHHAFASPVTSHRQENATTRNRVPGLPERNLDGIQRRSEMLLFNNDGVDVRAGAGREKDRMGLRPADEPGIGVNAGTDASGTSSEDSGSSRARAGKSGSGQSGSAGQAGNPRRHHVAQPSSVIARVTAEQRERYEQAADKERYVEIRQHLDCSQLLASLSHSHGLNLDLYQVATAKDGTPRIRAGSCSLTPNDFLTKELGLPWKEAAPILRRVYELQINSRVTKPRSEKAAPAQLWKEFKAEQKARHPAVAHRLKVFDATAKARRAGLANMLKGEQKTMLAGLSGPARQAAHSLHKLHAAKAKAELENALKQEGQILRESIQPSQANGWRIFLQTRAQAGNEDALTALRKLDDTARAEQAQMPTITGTIVLEDQDEKKRRRNRESATSFLKTLAYAVETNGDITYRHHGQAILRDEGRHLAVLDENSEEAITAGLLLGREKFGGKLTLTGSDAFQRRVVQVAAAQGIGVRFIDPQLEAYRQQLINEKRQAAQAGRTPKPQPPNEIQQAQRTAAPTIQEQIAVEPIIQTPLECLRAKVLAINPNAQIVIADPNDSRLLYSGPVIASLDPSAGEGIGFAQRTGRGAYTLHQNPPPEHHGASIDIKYRGGQAVAIIPDHAKGIEI